MKKTLKDHKFLFISLTLLFITTVLLGTIRIDYDFKAPGYNTNVDEFLEIESQYDSSGSFHTTSVIAFERITMMQYLFGNIMAKVDIDESPEYYNNINVSDLNVMGRLQKDDSLQTALIVASLRANYDIEYSSYYTIYLTYTHITKDTIEAGDKLLEVDGNTDVIEGINGLSENECGVETSFKVLRDDETLTFTLTKNLVDETNPESNCSYGLYIGLLNEIIESDINYTLQNTNTQGNSGGLLQTLYVFNQLTEFDYTRGLKIAGTGTININGEVGYIGGVRQKVITSIANDIDIFFIPHLSDEETDDYIEALKVLEEFETDMIVVPVTTIDDAISYLENYDK